MRTGRPASVAAILLIAFPLASCGCGGEHESAGPETEGAEGAILGDLLAGTWMARAAAEPAVVAALLDSPGGEGWAALRRGDLAAAQAAFSGKSHPAGRVGLAACHLARADLLREAEALHIDAAWDLARFRSRHAGSVRGGPLDALFGGLAAVPVSLPRDERDAAIARAVAAPADGEAADLRRLLDARLAAWSDGATEVVPPGLGGILAERAGAAARVAAGSIPDLATVYAGGPDATDALGADEQLGVRFQNAWYDPERLRVAIRAELLLAWTAAGAVPGVGDVLADLIREAWGGAPPELPPSSELPSPPGDGVPVWSLLFGSPYPDTQSLLAHWGGARDDERGFASRVDEQVPAWGSRRGTTLADTDATLRAAEALAVAADAALGTDAGPDGQSLIRDLRFGLSLSDRLLRDRAEEALRDGAPAQAKRLLDRSLDPAPDGVGALFVSARNDRAFLVQMARTTWRAGHPGDGLVFLHPLAGETRLLEGAVYYLGQLDAASSIGAAGKVNQQ